jgi:hypothetical protein
LSEFEVFQRIEGLVPILERVKGTWLRVQGAGLGNWASRVHVLGIMLQGFERRGLEGAWFKVQGADVAG